MSDPVTKTSQCLRIENTLLSQQSMANMSVLSSLWNTCSPKLVCHDDEWRCKRTRLLLCLSGWHHHIFKFRERTLRPYQKKIFACLCKAVIKVKFYKMQLSESQIHYLGHLLSQEGISYLPEKFDVVKSRPPPQNIRAQTVLRTNKLLQKPHQSLCQHHTYTTTEEGHTVPMDITTSKNLQRT